MGEDPFASLEGLALDEGGKAVPVEDVTFGQTSTGKFHAGRDDIGKINQFIASPHRFQVTGRIDHKGNPRTFFGIGIGLAIRARTVVSGIHNDSIFKLSGRLQMLNEPADLVVDVTDARLKVVLYQLARLLPIAIEFGNNGCAPFAGVIWIAHPMR